MPVYEFYCPTCAVKFEKLRPMSAADAPVSCAAGHAGARRLISVFAVGARPGEEAVMSPTGGGCCGGGACACGR